MQTTTADRREAIVDAASSLMAEAGSRGTSVAAVAERVGITDAGVLYHFRTKHDLLLAVLERFDLDAVALYVDERSGIDALRSIGGWGASMERVPQIQSLLVVLTAEHLHTDGPVRDYLVRRYRAVLGHVRDAFAEAAVDGDLRADLDPDQEASDLVAHLDGIRLQWFLLGREVSMAASVRAHVDHALERLAPTGSARR
ncbi:MAG: TetR/AcrR family transcriptional regulator [Actinobacteria bacterium]|nr:TetR/AcrR family transcriptional regulator [Actinomycetota bacterium]